ncbi:MAG: polysaccharide pyruvyl transferase family protein [Chloroflexota bacterium]
MLEELPEPILVVGGYGYRNVGDEAILAGLLGQIGRDRSVSVVSRMPAETAAIHGVRAIPLREAVLGIRGYGSVIIGGGGLFGRDMGAIGRLLPLYALLASALGLRVAIHGVGIDRDMRPITAVLLRRLADRAVAFTVRDRRSVQVLAEWGIAADLVPDLSAGVQPAPASVGRELLRQAGLDPDRPVVGLALTALRPHQAAALEGAVARCIADLPDVQFCFIPMSQHPFVHAHNDLLLGYRLKLRSPRLAVLEPSLPPDQLMAIFRGLSAVVSMRYHSLLFAERMGVPIIPLPYAPKCDAWIAEHGLRPVSLAPATLASAIRGAVGAGRAIHVA